LRLAGHRHPPGPRGSAAAQPRLRLQRRRPRRRHGLLPGPRPLHPGRGGPGVNAPTAPRWYAHDRTPGWTTTPPDPAAIAFHRALPDYAPTPLVDAPALAAELRVGHVLIKDETNRLGLPAFKALGATGAVHRALTERGTPAGPVTVVTATDGNHGRAVARSARLLGHRANIYVTARRVHHRAVSAIRREGASGV